MAKAATAKNASDDKKKRKKAPPAASVAVKTKPKKDKVAKAAKKIERKAAPKSNAKAGRSEGYEGLAKLVDHPLVADLLAAGAIAAVAAIAEHQLGSGPRQTSSKMVKSVGKAAAAAMGKKLFGDIGAITTAATDAAKKA